MKQSKFDRDMIELFEIKESKYSSNKNIRSVIEFDSINQLNLLSYLDNKKITASVEDLKKLKRFSDIYKFFMKK